MPAAARASDRPSADAAEILVLTPAVRRSRFARGRAGERIVWLFAFGAVGALLATILLVIQPRGGSRADLARIEIDTFANEAFPQFVAAYPSRGCPADLHELVPWMHREDTHDPWGTPYAMSCSALRIVVGSAGEDAVFGTEDDLWSTR